jgi:arylsulfatase A-like enzyme
MPAAPATDRPNILPIITAHHAFYGHDRSSGRATFVLGMPNFERLAAGGTRFDRAYSACPICTPARASITTGLYPSTHGLRWNTDGGRPARMVDFRPRQLLYSHSLSRAGYRNAYVSKWHCGRERLPVDYGVEGWSLPGYGKPYMDDVYKEYASRFGHPTPAPALSTASTGRTGRPRRWCCTTPPRGSS